MKIMILPIKNLRSIKEEISGEFPTYAILCSSYVIADSDFAWNHHISLRFQDTVVREQPESFQEDMAGQIAEFAHDLDSVGTLYICCDSGESRSTAIAAAFYRYYGMDERQIWRNPIYHPNSLVYQLQCKALGCPSSRYHRKRMVKMNKKVFSKEIKKAYNSSGKNYK